MKFLKFLFILLVAAAGFMTGGQFAQESGELEPILGAGVGAAIGFVLGLLMMKFWRVMLSLAALAGIGLGLYLFLTKGERQIGPYVDVTFEIRAIGTSATYKYGIDYGQGFFGTMSEGVKSERVAVRVGQPVTARAVADTGPSSSSWYNPSHQLICRIIVRGDEIYLHGDQGTRDDPAEVVCRGPVYIPRDEDR